MLPQSVRGRLRTKIIAWSFVPTAIILVAVALVSLYAYQWMTESLVVDRDRAMTRLSAELLAPELAAYTDPFSDQFLAMFDGLIAFDADGEVMATEPLAAGRRRPAWLREMHLTSLADSSQPAFSRVITDRALGEQIVVVIIPLKEEGSEPSGGIAGYFRLGARTGSVLNRSVAKIRRQESSNVYLVDSSGPAGPPP